MADEIDKLKEMIANLEKEKTTKEEKPDPTDVITQVRDVGIYRAEMVNQYVNLNANLKSISESLSVLSEKIKNINVKKILEDLEDKKVAKKKPEKEEEQTEEAQEEEDW